MSQKYEDNLRQLTPFDFGAKEEDFIAAYYYAFARQLQIIETKSTELVAEIFAATTVKELSDHERNWGLPDPCTGPLETIPERQLAFQLRKRSSLAGLSRQFYIDLAAQVGYVVTIDETINGEVYTWQVNLPYAEQADWLYAAGVFRAGDPINITGLQPLECLFQRLKPEHTVVTFTYTP